MARQQREPFNTGKPFIATKRFKFNGTEHEIGDVFDWQGLGCDGRRLLQMYDARKIVNAANNESPTLQVKSKPTASGDGITPGAKGWFEVRVGDEVAKVRGEDAAKAKFEELTAAATVTA